MSEISAKDIQALRQATGAGILDCRRALRETSGDLDAAKLWLREQGIVSAGKRSERESSQGAVALVVSGGARQVGTIAALRCETDFVAKSAEFVTLVDTVADAVSTAGEGAADGFASEIDNLKVVLKENISLGRIVRIEASEGAVIGSYLHMQADRGVNAVLVELAGAGAELAHDIAVHIAFARPEYLRREDVPEELVETERKTIETLSRNEGKPEAALGKIVEGRLRGWYKERCLLEQDFVRDEKTTVARLLGDATVLSFAQVVIGG